MHRSWEGCFVSGAWFGLGVRRDAVARVVAGESALAVARDLGCCRGSVSLWCQEAVWSWCAAPRVGRSRPDRPDAPQAIGAVLAGASLTRAGACSGRVGRGRLPARPALSDQDPLGVADALPAPDPP